jgi:hypothetical protein
MTFLRNKAIALAASPFYRSIMVFAAPIENPGARPL